MLHGRTNTHLKKYHIDTQEIFSTHFPLLLYPFQAMSFNLQHVVLGEHCRVCTVTAACTLQHYLLCCHLETNFAFDIFSL